MSSSRVAKALRPADTFVQVLKGNAVLACTAYNAHPSVQEILRNLADLTKDGRGRYGLVVIIFRKVTTQFDLCP